MEGSPHCRHGGVIVGHGKTLSDAGDNQQIRVAERSERPGKMLSTFVINLDRSKERWAKISESTRNTGLDLHRLPAVDGRDFAGDFPSGSLDQQAFRERHGRKVLAGEFGCYLSHLAALARIAGGDADLAIIAEDDVLFAPNLEERVRAIFAAGPQIELLKLVNHRTSAFLRHGRSSLGDEFGRCLHGPQGSAACYVVSRAGAAKLLAALETMWLPYDIAFERGWSTGVATFTTHRPLVRFQPEQAATTIATRIEYRNSKLPKLGQFKVLAFRAGDYVRRVAYAMRGKWF